MTSQIGINPSLISQLGSTEDATFCLVTNPEMAELFVLNRDAGYRDYRIVPFRSGDSFEQLLTHVIPERSHILVISPGRFFESPPSELLGRRKVIAMACNSTPTDPDIIRHFISVIERTSATEQEHFSDVFFEMIEEADHLEYRNERYGTSAVLEHFSRDLVWNQQAGRVDWGEQQIVPSGEISVLPIEITDFDEEASLPLNGELTFHGYPILHNGTPSFTRADQARIHRQLAPMQDHAIIAQIVDGRITGIRPVDEGATPAVKMLEAMFEVDSRYQHLWEIGHALNTSLDLLPGNHAMNEVYGGAKGCLHLGIGLTPYTQFHLDVIVPGTTVYTDSGQIVLGVRGGAADVRLAERTAA